jgi:hypothetical protein
MKYFRFNVTFERMKSLVIFVRQDILESDDTIDRYVEENPDILEAIYDRPGSEWNLASDRVENKWDAVDNIPSDFEEIDDGILAPKMNRPNKVTLSPSRMGDPLDRIEDWKRAFNKGDLTLMEEFLGTFPDMPAWAISSIMAGEYHKEGKDLIILRQCST